MSGIFGGLPSSGGGGGGGVFDGEAANFAALPSAASSAGQLYVVLAETGSWVAGTLKRAGAYYCDGASWTHLGDSNYLVKTESTTVTDNTVPRFSGTSGASIQSSGVAIDDSNNVSGVYDLSIDNNLIVTNNITMSGGTVAGRNLVTDGSKLDGIEAGADVTDAANVDAAGAVMNSDTSTVAMSFVVDEDTMTSDSATKVPTQQSVKAYVDTGLATKAASSHTHAASDITSGTLVHERGGLEADVSTYDGILRISGGSTSNLKFSNSKTAAPTVSDDNTGNWSVGSTWIDITNDKAYVCVDASTGAAVWKETTAPVTHTHAASDITSGTLVHERGGLEADVSAYDGLVSISSGSTSNIKIANNKTAAPGASDDNTAGWVVNSIWTDTTNDKSYICVDASTGAAVWKETTASGGSVAEIVSADASASSKLRFYEQTTGGSNYYEFVTSSATWTTNRTITIPALTSSYNLSVLASGAGSFLQSSSETGSYFACRTSAGGVGANNFRHYVYHRPIANLGTTYNYPVAGFYGIDTSTSALTMTNDRLYGFPVYVPYAVKTLNIGIHTADASGTADVDAALYTFVPEATNKVAATRVASFTQISNISTTGVKTTTSGDTIHPGWYMLGILATNIGTSLIISAPVASDTNFVKNVWGFGTSETTDSTITGVYWDTVTAIPSSLYSTGLHNGTISTACGITLEIS